MPGVVSCFEDNMLLGFGKVNNSREEKQFHNQNGVRTRINDFGGVSGMDFLDPRTSRSDYYGTLIKTMKQIGYEVGKNLRGAPYDWRYASYSAPLQAFRNQLKALIEETFHMNNGTPVSLVSHSYGSLNLVVFLSEETSEWKEKYIRRVMSLSGVFAGTPVSVSVALSGDSFGIPILSAASARIIQRTLESNYLFFPRNRYNADKVLVSTKDRSFTYAQIKELFLHFNLTEESERYSYVNEKAKKYKDIEPGLSAGKFYCMYGSEVIHQCRLVTPMETLTLNLWARWETETELLIWIVCFGVPSGQTPQWKPSPRFHTDR
eukprot:TRINITY_DN4742_c0_g1_i1.p1 TRINITY_DN4742_c0_g1~~TRINITY_DN4742_c0_g1_i1.p1  ORF type:complete len:320 (-),score=47.16 TRINITY_DN4742_c0_g1_i1:73-1032(-)